jgi:hypothetical protein
MNFWNKEDWTDDGLLRGARLSSMQTGTECRVSKSDEFRTDGLQRSNLYAIERYILREFNRNSIDGTHQTPSFSFIVMKSCGFIMDQASNK